MRHLFNGTRTIVKSAVAALLIGLVSSIAWNALLIGNLMTSPAIPWSVPTMALVLVLMWQFLGGKWGPRATAPARRSYLRAVPVPRRVLAISLLAGGLSLVALAGLWIVLVELTGAGGNPTITSYAAFPPLTLALGLIMGSLVSPLTEEAAFRGYCQVMLQRTFGGGVAILLSSLLFALFHGPTQGFAWSKLLFYFLVGIVFGTIAHLTRSTLPAIPVHIAGDLTFFFLVWPHDATRRLVLRDGADIWFWISSAQALVFAALAILAFIWLARLMKTSPARQASTHTVHTPHIPYVEGHVLSSADVAHA